MDQHKEQNLAELLSTIRAGDHQAPPADTAYVDAFDDRQQPHRASSSSYHQGRDGGRPSADTGRGRRGKDSDMRRQYKSKGESRRAQKESRSVSVHSHTGVT